MNPIVSRCKSLLQAHYGRKFQGMILYGSAARKKLGSESDIDLLVLLKKPFDYFRELRKLTDLLYTLQLECPRLISARPAYMDEYKRGVIQLYRNIQREGVLV